MTDDDLDTLSNNCRILHEEMASIVPWNDQEGENLVPIREKLLICAAMLELMKLKNRYNRVIASDGKERHVDDIFLGYSFRELKGAASWLSKENEYENIVRKLLVGASEEYLGSFHYMMCCETERMLEKDD